MTAGIALLSAVALSGCAKDTHIATLLGGECKVIPPQQYVVLGKTDYDQGWIDETEVGAQAACPNRPAPKERPPELDAPKKKPVAVAKSAPPPKRHFWQRKPKPVAAGFVAPLRLPERRPVAETPQRGGAAPAQPAPVETEQGDAAAPVTQERVDESPKPAAVPVDPLDDLLGPPRAMPPAPKSRWCLWNC